MYKVLVIGGAGFIGVSIVRLMSHDPFYDVTVLGRSDIPKNILPPNVRYVSADLLSIDVCDVLEGFDCVIDLAYSSLPSTSYFDPINDILKNIPLHVRLFEAAIKVKISKYLYISSGGAVYGDHGFKSLIESELNKPMSPYGITKLAIEHYANFYFRQFGFPVIIVRPSNPYGADQLSNKGQGFIAAAYRAIKSDSELVIYGEEGTYRDYIYIDDVAKGVVHLIHNGLNGEVYNIGSGICFNNIEILMQLNNIMGMKELKVKHLPRRPFDVAFNLLNVEKIKSTGYRGPSIGLADGLRKMIREIER